MLILLIKTYSYHGMRTKLTQKHGHFTAFIGQNLTFLKKLTQKIGLW